MFLKQENGLTRDCIVVMEKNRSSSKKIYELPIHERNITIWQKLSRYELNKLKKNSEIINGIKNDMN